MAFKADVLTAVARMFIPLSAASLVSPCYEALYGEHPFGASDAAEMMANAAAGKVREPPSGAGIPRRVRKIVLRGLRVDPGTRYPTIDMLLAALTDDPARRLRLGALAVVGVASLAAIAFGHRYTTALAAGAACTGGDARIATVWGAVQKDRVERAFLATGKPYAADAWKGTEKTLDAYGKEWAGERTAACEATWVKREQSGELLDLRMACLDHRLEEFGALTSLFAEADADTVSHAVAASQSLTRIADCHAMQVEASRVKRPSSPEIRAEVEHLRRELDRAKALDDAVHHGSRARRRNRSRRAAGACRRSFVRR